MGLLLATLGTAEEDKPAEPATLATVNGTALTKLHFDSLLSQYRPETQMQARTNKGRFMRELVLQEVLAQECRRTKLDQDPELQARIRIATNGVLARAMVQKNVKENAITDDALRKHYEANKGKYRSDEQVTASHILVKTEEEAKAVALALAGGADFADLARKKSTGPSGPRGGVLGTFGRGRMVPAFEKTAFALKAGEVSAPVKTQFGWHVIKVTARTDGATRPFEAVKEDIRRELTSELINALLKKLQDDATIEIKDPAYKFDE